MEETISLKELFQTIKKRLSLILLITFTAVAVSGILSYFVLTPIYSVSTQILVNKTSDDIQYNYSEVQTNLQLINTYNVIIKSDRILDIVAEEIDGDFIASQLKEKITVSSEQNSQVITLAVEDADPNTAATIANKTAEVFQSQIAEIMKVDNVSILAKAEVAENISPVKPKPILNIAIALVVGLMAGVGIAFLLEYLDNTIKTESDIEKLLELPVLGVISTISESDLQAAPEQGRASRGVRGESIG